MRYRTLGKGTGLKVSSIALGTGLFGAAWGYGAEESEAQRVLAAYLEAGGNFIDTADGYQSGEAEKFLGRNLGAARNDVVLASKFSFGATEQPATVRIGNSRLNMIRSVEESLKRLNTDRIDLLYIHNPDGITAVDEILYGFEALIRAGKIVYGGLSNFAAWQVARAVTHAELSQIPSIAAIQIEYSLVERTSDREIIPMAAALGVGVTAWGPLAGGLLTGKYHDGHGGATKAVEPGTRSEEWSFMVHEKTDARNNRIVEEVIAIAKERGRVPSEIALAWLIAKGVVPVIGARTMKQIEDNLGGATVDLDQAEFDRLDRASAIELGFPHDRLGAEWVKARFETARQLAPVQDLEIEPRLS